MGLAALDQRMIACVEHLCQRFERLTGKTNHFWFRLCSGAYAAFLAFFIGWVEILHLETSMIAKTLSAILALVFFYLSFFYGDKAEVAARERVRKGFANPMKALPMFFYMRIVMLMYAIAPLASYAVFAMNMSAKMFDIGVLAYIATCSLSFCIFWLCLVLDACDPDRLPPKERTFAAFLGRLFPRRVRS